MNPFCFWCNSLLIKWFTLIELAIRTTVFTKKCLYAKILKTGIFIFDYRFVLHCQENFWEQTIHLEFKHLRNKMLWKLNVLPKFKIDMWRGHCADFAIHMTILFDLSSVLITYIFGNSLIKTSFEAEDISSNWKLKTMLFLWTFGFMFKHCHPTTTAQLFTKTYWYRFRLFLRWRWIKCDFLINLCKLIVS